MVQAYQVADCFTPIDHFDSTVSAHCGTGNQVLFAIDLDLIM